MKGLRILIFLALIISGCGGGGGGSNDVGTGGSGEDTTDPFTIDIITQYGEQPAIAIGSDGNPQISYIDHDDKYVKYAIWNGSSWDISSVGYAAADTGTLANGGISSIALDSSNNPHITYYELTTVNFIYAKKTGASWSLTTIPLPRDPLITSYVSPLMPSTESSIAIDSVGNAHISLQMLGGMSGYVLGYWKTGLSKAVIVDSNGGSIGSHNSIALDGDGYPCISYEDRSTHLLQLARWDGADFNIESIDTMEGISWAYHLTSTKVDTSGNPHIVYYGDGNYMYTHPNGDSWYLDSLPYHTGYPSLSLCLDKAGNPHVVLIADSGYKLQYGYFNGSEWSFTTVDTNVNSCVIALDSSDKVHIVYNTGSDNVLKHATK